MSRRRAAIVAAALAALLCGCARYQPAPLSPADTAQALERRSLDDPRLLKFISAATAGHEKVEPTSWDLTSLTLAAVYYHPDLRIARARLAAAQAAEITARESPNPALHLTNIIDQAAVPGALPAAAAAITIGPVIDFMIETAGKREARTAQAQHLVEAARWDLITAGWQLRGQVRNALLGLWAARQRLALTQRSLDLQQQLVQLLRNRLVAGEAAAPELDREHMRYAQMIVTRSDLRRAEAEAHAQLAAAIGIPNDGLAGAALNLHAFVQPPPTLLPGDWAQWRHRALTQRSDVQASLASYESAQAALRLAVANQYPNLVLGPGYNYDAGVNRYVLDLGTTIPIFQHAQGGIEQALARRREAAAELTKVQAGIIAAIDQAQLDFRISSQGVSAADAVLGDERRRTARVAAAFRAGQADRPSMVSAQLVLVASESDRLAEVVHQRQALAALEDALQRPLFEPDVILPLPDVGPSS